MTWGQIKRLFTSLFLVLIIVGYISAQQKFPIQSKHSVTKELIDIQVTDIDGLTMPLSSIIPSDRNYIISIMASWCGPCRTELNAFQKVAEDWKCDLNTEIIAISIEKPTDTYKLVNLVQKQNWTMQVVHDKMSYTGRELGVFDIPQTFLVNQDKVITYTTSGYHSGLIKDYEVEIRKLLD